MVWGKLNKFVKLDFTWTDSKYDVKESGIDSLQSMLIALKSLEFDIKQLKEFDSNAFFRILGSDWSLRRVKRVWHSISTFKYIMNNAYIHPKFANTRDFKDDVTAHKVHRALLNKYPSMNVQVVRLGSLKSNFIPSRLLITTSQKLDEKYLHQDCRRINGQRVTWERFNNNNKPKKEYHDLSNQERLKIFRNLKLKVGLHKGFEFNGIGEEEEQKIIKVNDDDYNHLTAFWRSTVNDTTLTSEIYSKLSEMYNGDDGNAWCLHENKDKEDEFNQYAEELYNKQKEVILNNVINEDEVEEKKDGDQVLVNSQTSNHVEDDELNGNSDVVIFDNTSSQSSQLFITAKNKDKHKRIFSFGFNNDKNKNKANSNIGSNDNEFKF